MSAPADRALAGPGTAGTTRVVVATSVMLSFISFWRAAAIVLADLGSSAFYAGGIAEQAVGRAAPWLILGVMLFSYAVRAVYMESCAMFTRGGVYRVVKEAMGGTMAKLSVSALLFDYILTGPISGVSAGQYIVSLTAQTMTYLGHPWHPGKPTIDHWAAVIAVAVTIYFWWRNTQGIHESSDDALRILKITTVMVVIMIAWSLLTIAGRPAAQRLPPPPTAAHLDFNEHAVGWMPALLPHAFERRRQAPPSAQGAEGVAHAETERFVISPAAGSLIGLIGLLIAFGHSILAMSGEETLAQVNRELEHPKHKNLKRAGLVIFVYSLLFTSLVSFFAYALIPDAERTRYVDNLIAGIAMYLAGPLWMRLGFQAFIVFVGFLLLSGACNTSIIGSNAVLNRVSEDGVLTAWFRAPHRRYGTTYRMINLVAALQVTTIIVSRGDVYILGEAYAFGVVWSFAFNALAMMVLRYKDRSPREWRVPGNLRVGRVEVPLGLMSVAALLFTIAIVNMITKQVATVSGLAITAVFSSIFFFSERANERQRKEAKHSHPLDQFNLQPQERVGAESIGVRPGSVLCPVRDYNNLDHVRRALELTPTDAQDIVVMTVHTLRGPDGSYRDLPEDQLFTEYEQLLFSRVVALAEKAGKHVELMVVPSTDPLQAVAQAAANLYSAEIIMGRSAVLTPREQAARIGEAWERLEKKPRHEVRVHIVDTDGTVHEFSLGAHQPELSPEDVQQVHALWVDVRNALGDPDLRHRDIVSLALTRLEHDLHGHDRGRVIEETARARGR